MDWVELLRSGFDLRQTRGRLVVGIIVLGTLSILILGLFVDSSSKSTKKLEEWDGLDGIESGRPYVTTRPELADAAASVEELDMDVCDDPDINTKPLACFLLQEYPWYVVMGKETTDDCWVVIKDSGINSLIIYDISNTYPNNEDCL